MGLETPQAGGCSGQKPLSLGRCFGGHWLGFQAGKVGQGGGEVLAFGSCRLLPDRPLDLGQQGMLGLRHAPRMRIDGKS